MLHLTAKTCRKLSFLGPLKYTLCMGLVLPKIHDFRHPVFFLMVHMGLATSVGRCNWPRCAFASLRPRKGELVWWKRTNCSTVALRVFTECSPPPGENLASARLGRSGISGVVNRRTPAHADAHRGRTCRAPPQKRYSPKAEPNSRCIPAKRTQRGVFVFWVLATRGSEDLCFFFWEGPNSIL